MDALASKHPPCRSDFSFHLPACSLSTAIHIQESVILKSVMSFPSGSAGGPDGLNPQHLKELISPSAEHSGKVLVSSLTSFTNFVQEIPPSVRPIFFWSLITCLKEKKVGGIRPIAVGLTLCRFVAKCLSSSLVGSMGVVLHPLQLGFGTPGGAEAAVHATRLYLHCLTNSIMVRLDFKNAFNSLRRDEMLTAVQNLVPDFPFVFSAYENPLFLFFGEETILSQEAVQQGDPLGPLLFCLTIHSLILEMKSELKIFYLDDGSLGGSLSEVLADLKKVESLAVELGLVLNSSKSVVISVP